MDVTINNFGEALGCNDRCIEKLGGTVTCRLTDFDETKCWWRYSDYLLTEGGLEEMFIYVQTGQGNCVMGAEEGDYYIAVEVHLTNTVCTYTYEGVEYEVAPFWYFKKCLSGPLDCMALNEVLQPDYDDPRGWFFVNWDEDGVDPGCNLDNATVTVVAHV